MGFMSWLWNRGAWSLEFKGAIWKPNVQTVLKIRKCRLALVDWSHTIFKGVRNKLKEKQSELEGLSNMNQAKHLPWIRELKTEINIHLHQEELFWRQRSRSIWLQARDKNTKYFHYKANQRRRKNHFSRINDSNRNCCTTKDQIAKVAEKYFAHSFNLANPMDLEGGFGLDGLSGNSNNEQYFTPVRHIGWSQTGAVSNALLKVIWTW